MREILAALPGRVNMTDDILVFGKTPVEHHRNLMAVLQRLEETGFTINLEKSEFYKEELISFDLRFTQQGILQTEDNVKAFKDAQPPEDAKVLRRFLCSLTWSSRFMPNICTTAIQLWKLEEKDEFDSLKRAITTKCVGNKDLQSILTVDASPVGLDAVLQQYNPKDPSQRHTNVVIRGEEI